MLTAPRTFMRHATFSADGTLVKQYKLGSRRRAREETGKGEIRAELAGSCLKAAVYLIVFHRNSSPVYPCREIDMAVFEAPL